MIEQTAIPTCKNCKHRTWIPRFPDFFLGKNFCAIGENDSVNGDPQYCFIARLPHKPCGPLGAKFEPNKSALTQGDAK